MQKEKENFLLLRIVIFFFICIFWTLLISLLSFTPMFKKKKKKKKSLQSENILFFSMRIIRNPPIVIWIPVSAYFIHSKTFHRIPSLLYFTTCIVARGDEGLHKHSGALLGRQNHRRNQHSTWHRRAQDPGVS